MIARTLSLDVTFVLLELLVPNPVRRLRGQLGMQLKMLVDVRVETYRRTGIDRLASLARRLDRSGCSQTSCLRDFRRGFHKGLPRLADSLGAEDAVVWKEGDDVLEDLAGVEGGFAGGHAGLGAGTCRRLETLWGGIEEEMRRVHVTCLIHHVRCRSNEVMLEADLRRVILKDAKAAFATDSERSSGLELRLVMPCEEAHLEFLLHGRTHC